MDKIKIELFRYEKEGSTCCRCGDSTEVVRKVVNELKSVGMDIELEEIIVDEDRIDISNTVKINGRDIMDIMEEKMRILTDCPSCSDLIGRKTACNSYIYRGKIYESLPETMLKEAIYRQVYK
ncbi:MAG TPA: DUF2703 domain-containing protein, partial [Syntrophorhabdaceae bacterium]|nr:DUF2703 domain-containing protein [Syntrophorhabdaceae bacterium]